MREIVAIGEIWDDSWLVVYQTLSIECLSYIFFWHVLCVLVPFFWSFFLLFFVFVFMLSLQLCRSSSDIFVSSRPRTGLATAYITWHG